MIVQRLGTCETVVSVGAMSPSATSARHVDRDTCSGASGVVKQGGIPANTKVL